MYYIYFSLYIYYIYTFLSRFSRCTKLSQCREQRGSATLAIVTLHLLSTLPIQSERLPLTIILLATLRYDVSLFCQDTYIHAYAYVYMYMYIYISPALLSLLNTLLLLFCLLLFCHHYSHLPNDEGTCRERKENSAT